MKKNYQKPTMEVVHLDIKAPMLIAMSSTETDVQLAPDFTTEPEFEMF